VRNAALHFALAIVNIAPGWFVHKTKLHLLMAHVVDDITRFSLMKNFHEEPFESHNAVIRYTCIFSNRQGTSHDSSRQFEVMEFMRHLMSGGFFYSNTRNKWIQAGVGVLDFVKRSVPFQKLYNLRAREDDPVPGEDVCSSAQRPSLTRSA
jgi:hypothetical protein